MKKFSNRQPWVLLFIFICFTHLLLAQHYSWQKLNTEPYKGKQDDIYFVNESCGWYCNGYGKIYHTSNGGETWTLQWEQKGTFFRCLAFIDSLTGFAGTVGTDYFPYVTDTVPLYKTTDGGKSWFPVRYTGSYVKGLCAIDIVKEQYINHGEIDYKYHVYAVGRVGSPANLMVSHDGGNAFESIDMTKYASMLFDIKMFTTKEGFACAASHADIEESHARIIYTKDGGKSWKTVYESKRPYENSWKIYFVNKKIGYATIQHYNPDSNIIKQYIIKTTNGGKKWKEKLVCKEYGAREFGIGFIDEKHGFVGTMNSGYETLNGGKTWKKIDLGRACNKIRIMKTPSGKIYGYAIGVNVFKLKQED